MKPSAPAAPDPTATIAAQSAANSQSAQQTAELNRINQVTPYGSSTYSTDGTYSDGTPQYTQTTTLSPSQQNLFNMGQQGEQTLGQTALGALGNVQSQYATPFDPSNFGASVKQAQDAAYNAQTQYLDPQFEQGQKSLDNSLINQGITQGSEAYNNAEGNYGRQKQAAYQSAQNAAVGAGNQEQSTLYGQALTNYNQPLNTYNALATGAQVQNPSFSSTPGANVATTDVGGITNSAYANQLAAYNAQNSGLNNLLSLGGNLGAAAIISDRRLKREIRRAGTLSNGIPTYFFKYIDTIDDSERIFHGVMADEVLPIIPDAVVIDDDGYMAVDYGKLR